MFRRFTSIFSGMVDAQGRVRLPAAFRRTLEAREAEGRLVLLPGFRQSGCLEGYAPDAFARIAEGIERMHPSHPSRHLLERRIMGEAVTVHLDGSGRMALPSRSSARYGLAGNAKAVFVGMGDRFELWEEGAHDAFMANFSEDPGALADMPWPET